jgi:hypothetical protein
MICNKFGLVQLDHIRDLVTCLISGWSIAISPSCDISQAGQVFAKALRSSAQSADEVANAFTEGVEEGTRVLQFWNKRRRSGPRRARTT